jgi:hypothetical protein
MFGVALVLFLWTIFGLAAMVFLMGDPEEISSYGNLIGRISVLAMLVGAWAFFGMHARSLVIVKGMVRDMAYKPFEGMRPDEVIALLEEHLSKKGLPYQRLSLTGGMPREFVPGSMRYLKEIFEMEAVGTRIVLQPYSYGDDVKGIAAFTPVFLGPIADDNWSVVQGLMNDLGPGS